MELKPLQDRQNHKEGNAAECSSYSTVAPKLQVTLMARGEVMDMAARESSVNRAVGAFVIF